MHQLEEDVPLRESRLWDLLLRYYNDLGATAWTKAKVPAFPTSNMAIADGYAQVIAAWAAELGERVTVMELGAGHGRFSHYCLRSLRSRGVDFRYLMTDAAPSNTAAWEKNPFLRPMFQLGLVSGRLHDATAPPPPVEGPLVVISNYCFDSLPADVFRLKRGALEEGHPILSAKSPIGDDPSVLSELRLDFSFHPIEPEGYYGEPDLEAVLGAYRERMGSGTFCFPVGTLRGLKPLLAREAPTLLLSMDKGYSHLHDIAGEDTVGFARHGSISFLVNYDAVAQLVQQAGGSVRLLETRQGPLEGGMFWTGGDCPATAAVFDEALSLFSPSDFHNLYNALYSLKKPKLKGVLALLRLSRYDPTVFCNFYERVLGEASKAQPRWKRQVEVALERVWDNAYPIDGVPDVAFAVARTYHRIGRYTRALERYQDSLDLAGAHPATHFNMGLCFHRLGQDLRARAEFNRALALDAGYGRARDWLVKLDA